jgi:hypothetical protein
MSQPQLQLVVIYSPNPQSMCAFYPLLGITFTRERLDAGQNTLPHNSAKWCSRFIPRLRMNRLSRACG